MSNSANGKTRIVIGDLEALLIRVMNLKNTAQMQFADAAEWMQIEKDEIAKYTSRLDA